MRNVVLTLVLFLFTAQSALAEKSEKVSLAAALVKRAQLTEAQAQEQAERVFSVIRAELKAGNNVEVKNFGSFSVKEKAQRVKGAPGAEKKPSAEKRKYPNFVSADSLKAELNPQKG